MWWFDEKMSKTKESIMKEKMITSKQWKSRTNTEILQSIETGVSVLYDRELLNYQKDYIIHLSICLMKLVKYVRG